MVTLQLNTKEALLVRVALEQEIKKGSTTFLSGRDVIALAKIAELLKSKELV
jgi:hypothetical protein